MYADGLVEDDVCKRAGVNLNTWIRWKYQGQTPDLKLIEAILEAIGLKLRVTVLEDKKKQDAR